MVEACQGQNEKWEKEWTEKLGFEIFKDVIDSTKGKHPLLPDAITETDIKELMRNLGLESKTKTLNYEEVTTILESRIDDILFEDIAVDMISVL